MAPAAFDVDALSSSIPAIFDQAQNSGATHKKNCVSLYKLQSSAATVTTSSSKSRKQKSDDSDILLVGEKTFAEIFLDMLSRVLVVKKGATTADRVVKFVGTYIKFLSEKSAQQDNSNDDEETFTTRFTTRLLRFLIKGFVAKDKFVRFRVVTLASEILEYMGEIEQDLYLELRLGLIERLHDKESFIRAQSAVGLSKLALSEDPDEVNDEEGDQPVMAHLLSTLSTDASAEVRRSVLMHLPFTPSTLPALLTRSHDPDALARKLVYSAIIPRLSHPKQLTIAQRENVVKEGLGDREDAVRVAAAKLLGSWVDLCDGDLTSFLELFDVRTSTSLTCDALKSVFVTRLEVVDLIKFDDAFWANLTPETTLLARTFVEHCIANEDAERLESSLPVVTALAFHLQTQYNRSLQLLIEKDGYEEDDEEQNDACEDQIADTEFIISELLRLAEHLDYADEIGRRKMFGVIREMLGHSSLPEELIDPCMAVLAILSPSERDLVRVVVEVVNELRDNDMDGMPSRDGLSQESDSTFGITLSQRSTKVRKQIAEMSPEEKAAADLVDLRCLTICIALLERVNTSFEENSTLEGILADLVVPSVKRKELALREKGLASLGLCCLIAKNMAMNSFQLFLSQVKSSPESLRLKNIQIVFDIMMSYEKDLLGEGVEIGQRVIAFLMQVLEAEESKAVQALICLGLSKLMLFGLVTDERVLTSLVLAYVSPITTTNPELRQCLAYFLPAYCYSSFEHQSRMQAAFLTSYDLVNRVYEEMEEDQNMIGPLQFGQLLVDWTDPSKVVSSNPDDQNASLAHLHLAIDLVRAMYDSDRSDEDKKIFCQLLSKLTLPEATDTFALYTLNILLLNLQNQCPFDDLATIKLFAKFRARFEQRFASLLETFDEQECFDSPDYQELFEFMGVNTRPSKARAKKAKAPPVTEQESEGVDEETVKSSRPRRTARSRKPDANGSESNASHSEEGDDSQPQPGPSRGQSPIAQVPQQENQSDAEKESDNEETDLVEIQPSSDQENQVQVQAVTPVKKKRGAKRIHTPTKSPSAESPVHKRQQRRTTARNRSPLENKTNKRGKSAPKHNEVSKSAVTRTRRGKKKEEVEPSEDEDQPQLLESPVAPRVMEEPAWDGESDI